ncbi:orotidine-5'-phosphate decarboxylase [Phenylobacterium sp. VNQ135]|uniref:orotidine-5'-phosphate decarboxylase n=1 Tax=Phenylobacterium sp. VNQ135 TaxID=3400922 RepID=UPI003C013B21
MIPFAQRFAELSRARSPLCIGLDPSEALIRRWGLSADAEGLRTFCGRVLDAVGDLAAVVKPQAAFFERFGAEGMAEFGAAIRRIRAQGSLALIDAKRGDVAGTMEGYAAAMLGQDGGFGGDAVTLNAYLGFDALQPVFERAQAEGAGVFVVVHSSNAEGRTLQCARHPDGRTVSEALADAVTRFNGPSTAVGLLGAVVGATLAADDAGLLDRLPRSLILAPGVGAQGASIADVAARFGAARGRVLPSVSRDVLARGPEPDVLREAILRYRDQAWALSDGAA